MKHGLLAAICALTLVAVASASAGGKTVQTTLSGRCSAVDQLDRNGALKSTTIVCTASGKCNCPGTTKLAYTTKSNQAGNGAPGPESGTFIASGPAGTVTLVFKGKRDGTGAGKGTWKLGKVTGYSGVKLAQSGTYQVTTKTVSEIVGTKDTIVRITATLGCWRC
jgi:hypothetical protein